MKLNSTFVIIGAILIILGILIAVLPQFSNCSSDGKEIALANGKTTPMKCFWSARSEMIPGVILLAIGIMFILSRKRETILFLSIIGLIASIFVLLMPLYFIGICSTPTMICNTVMKPAVIILAALAILDLVAGLVFAVRGKEEA